MNHKVVRYGILLTKEQLDFLKDDNQGFHRMKAFDTFLSLAAIEPFHYEKKNFSADLDIGQFAISKVELSELWHCDRKTAQKMIDLFNEVGILTSVANNRTTIHTIHCLAFWFVDGQQNPIRNPHYMRTPPYRFRKHAPKPTVPFTLSAAPTEISDDSYMQTDRGTNGVVSGHKDNQNEAVVGITNTEKSVVQANVPEPVSDIIGTSHPQLFKSSNPVSSFADANDDEREENMLPPYGEDGQLPEDYLEQLDEHYANLLPESDEPYRTSGDVTLGNTPSMPNNQEGIHIEEGSTNPLVSPTPNIVAADAPDNAESPRYGSDRHQEKATDKSEEV